MSDIINQNTEPLFIFDMPDDETLSETISVKGEKGERGDPTKLSDLENDEGFITVNTDELANYYTKTATDNLLNTKLDKSTFNALEMPSDFFTGDETVSGSGSNITLADTADATLKSITINGQTSQSGTPTPESPVDVETVTGTQTITITGDDTQTYELELGKIELNVLGTYKDRIWKNSTDSQFYNANLPTDAWCLHKETDHATIDSLTDGTTYAINTSSTNTTRVLISKCLNGQGIFSPESARLLAKCKHLQAKIMWSSDQVGFFIDTDANLTKNGLCFRIAKATVGTSATEVETWLNDNPLDIYYVLASPTDTLITDAKLVEQLEQLEKAHGGSGSTVIAVSGTLPALLSVEAYKRNWNGTTAGLNNELANIYTKTEVDNLLGDEVRFIFPKFWANVFSGDCNLIKYGAVNILIDCYNPTSGGIDAYAYVKSMLDDNDAKHIDVFICSHYHWDHIGSFEKLAQDGYIDSTTKLFMPAETTKFGWDQSIANQKARCNTYGITYYVPAENETYTIGDLKLTFYNCDAEAMDDYYPEGTGSQNATSMVTLFEHKNVKALYTGDATRLTYKRLRELGVITGKVALHKIGHHGIETSTDNNFFDKYNAEYAVISGGILDFAKNNFGLGSEATILQANGTKIYPTYMQEDYIEMVSDGDSMTCVKGDHYVSSHGAEGKTVYVDINATGAAIQDGTEEHPYHEIMQAIGNYPKGTTTVLRIVLAAGNYCLSHEAGATHGKNTLTIRDLNVQITTTADDPADTTINGIDISNGMLSLTGVTVHVDNHAFVAYNSRVLIRSCVITTSDGLITSAQDAIDSHESNIYIDNTTIENANRGIKAGTGSVIVAKNVTFGSLNTTTFIQKEKDTVLVDYGTSYANASDKYSDVKHFTNAIAPVLLYQSSASTYPSSITINSDFSKFNRVRIDYVTGRSTRGSKEIYTPNNKNFVLSEVAHNTVDMSEYFLRVNLTGNTVTLQYPLIRKTTFATSTVEYQQTDGLRIERIIGFNDDQVIDLS